MKWENCFFFFERLISFLRKELLLYSIYIIRAHFKCRLSWSSALESSCSNHRTNIAPFTFFNYLRITAVLPSVSELSDGLPTTQLDVFKRTLTRFPDEGLNRQAIGRVSHPFMRE